MKKTTDLLIIDDDDAILIMLSQYISRMDNINVHKAQSFEEGKTLLVEKRPKIIITDIELPDGNGLEIVKLAKKLSHAKQVIVMTGGSNIERLLEALAYGAADFLEKPLDMDLLKTVISESIERFERWEKLFKKELSKCRKKR